MHFPFGTLVNALAVVAGSLLGMLLQQNLPENIKRICFQAIGLCTLVLGFSLTLKAVDFLLLIVATLAGAILGEWMQLEEVFKRLGNSIKKRLGSSQGKFTDGFLSAFVLYCIGSMTILGALEEGLKGDATLLYAKSVLDGVSSIILASVYGLGVLVSAVPLFIFQASITLSATFLEPWLSTPVIDQLSATGGIMILGIGLNLLEIKEIKVTNFLPALAFSILLMFVLGKA